MIAGRVLRRMARERGMPLDIIEKDYALGWILNGVASSSLRSKLIFKGGTALSKVYFPFDWRISEDLDFTLSDHATLEEASAALLEELPGIVEEASGGMALGFKDGPFINPGFLRVRVQFDGPVSRSTVKIEVTREGFIGEYGVMDVPVAYDYPEFSVCSYTLGNILAEKLRSLLERTRIRDYYDSWRLLEGGFVDGAGVEELFIKKCEGRGVVFRGVEDFFPDDLIGRLEPYLGTLTRLTVEPLPPLSLMLDELRRDLGSRFG